MTAHPQSACEALLTSDSLTTIKTVIEDAADTTMKLNPQMSDKVKQDGILDPLLCQLTQGPLCVSELESAAGIQQPTLSQQLAVLRDEALVSTRREGKQIFYSIASNEAMAVLQVLYQLYCEQPNGAAS